MIYQFEIFGRPKNKALDSVMDSVNGYMQDILSDDTKVLLQTSIGITKITSKKEFSKEDLEKVKTMLQKTIEKYFSDVTIKQL